MNPPNATRKRGNRRPSPDSLLNNEESSSPHSDDGTRNSSIKPLTTQFVSPKKRRRSGAAKDSLPENIVLEAQENDSNITEDEGNSGKRRRTEEVSVNSTIVPSVPIYSNIGVDIMSVPATSAAVNPSIDNKLSENVGNDVDKKKFVTEGTNTDPSHNSLITNHRNHINKESKRPDNKSKQFLSLNGDQRKVFNTKTSIIIPNHQIVSSRRGITVINENERSLHLEERANFSSIVTPEVSNENHNREVIYLRNDPSTRNLFASTYFSLMRFFMFRLIVPALVILALFYFRAQIGSSSTPDVPISEIPKNPLISVTHEEKVEETLPVDLPQQLVTEVFASPQIVIKKKKDVQILSMEEIETVISDSSSVSVAVDELILSSDVLEDELNSAASKAASLEEELNKLSDDVNDRNDLVELLESVQTLESDVFSSLQPVEANLDSVGSDISLFDVNILQVKLSVASHLDDDNFNEENTQISDESSNEQLQVLSSIDSAISETSSFPGISTPIEVINGDPAVTSSSIIRPFIEDTRIDSFIEEHVREAFQQSRLLRLFDSHHEQPTEIVPIETHPSVPDFENDIVLSLSANPHIIDVNEDLNYASRSRGGRVVTEDLEQHSIRLTSPPHAASKGFFSKLRLRAGLLRRDSNPQVLLNDNLPRNSGSRYCFSGRDGTVTVTLRRPVLVHSVSFFNPNQGPTLDDSSVLPTSFRVIGWTSDDEDELIKYELGRFTNELTEENMNVHVDGDGHWMSFPIPELDTSRQALTIPALRAVTFVSLSNHGNDEQTCFYRVKIFGVEQSQHELVISQESLTHESVR